MTFRKHQKKHGMFTISQILGWNQENEGPYGAIKQDQTWRLDAWLNHGRFNINIIIMFKSW